MRLLFPKYNYAETEIKHPVPKEYALGGTLISEFRLQFFTNVRFLSKGIWYVQKVENSLITSFPIQQKDKFMLESIALACKTQRLSIPYDNIPKDIIQISEEDRLTILELLKTHPIDAIL